MQQLDCVCEPKSSLPVRACVVVLGHCGFTAQANELVARAIETQTHACALHRTSCLRWPANLGRGGAGAGEGREVAPVALSAAFSWSHERSHWAFCVLANVALRIFVRSSRRRRGIQILPSSRLPLARPHCGATTDLRPRFGSRAGVAQMQTPPATGVAGAGGRQPTGSPRDLARSANLRCSVLLPAGQLRELDQRQVGDALSNQIRGGALSCVNQSSVHPLRGVHGPAGRRVRGRRIERAWERANRSDAIPQCALLCVAPGSNNSRRRLRRPSDSRPARS